MSDFISLRKRIIEKEFENMNDMQKKAVFHVNGPLLIIAGAGSGKTTTMVNRVAYLIRFGNAYHSEEIPSYITDEDIHRLEAYLEGNGDFIFDPSTLLAVDAARPWQILAITFTNKAANELKERLSSILGDEQADDIWASTFHSCCARILRRFAEELGYTSSFSIYDTDDSKRLIKECQRQLDINDKLLSQKFILARISDVKNCLITPAEYERQAEDGRDANPLIAKVYKLYQEKLKNANAMDFDDLIFNTVRLLEGNASVREYYQRKFKYVMVDEYQDTNYAQVRLTQLLADGYGNICVVGDDDQSIYKFRGATIENILGFESQFENCAVIRLEQNYRSTKTILDAANAVISHNIGRKGKTLWTENETGGKIISYLAADETSEAEFVVSTIMKNTSVGGNKFSDHAVLYRTNAQSNRLEYIFSGSGIPYRIFGGHRFYERAEIRDAIAYLTVVNNPDDNIRLFRIINVPARGIGASTVNKISDLSLVTGRSAFDIIKSSDEFAVLQRSSAKLKLFAEMILKIREGLDEKPPNEILEDILQATNYIEYLESDEQKGRERIENIRELLTNLYSFSEENGEEATLEDFLEQIALLTDIDNYDANADAVVLMTLHSAKGLEFPFVFITGMEDGLFPGSASMYDASELEEERRLAYVGITRAKKQLYLIHADRRSIYKSISSNPPSRFLAEIPDELLEKRKDPRLSRETSSFALSYGSFQRRNSFSDRKSRPSFTSPSSQSKPKEEVSIDFSVGERVEHSTFGKGTILSYKKMGNDAFLEVAFDEKGTRKLMAKMARLKKL